MSSIAYVTDSKMLDFHRLMGNKTMNFWRLSNRISFSNLNVGDLVFFLSKDKKYLKNKEKGIIGFGRLTSIHLNSIRTMWERYGQLNGYNTIAEFKEAITKVAENGVTPKKISSFYLTDVYFFQTPLYLSDYGMDIPANVESFVYLSDPKITISLLEEGKTIPDLWFNLENTELDFERIELTYALNEAHKENSSLTMSENRSRKAFKELKKYTEDHSEFSFVQNCETEIYSIKENVITLVMYKDSHLSLKEVIGHCHLYRHYFEKYYPYSYNLEFRLLNEKELATIPAL